MTKHEQSIQHQAEMLARSKGYSTPDITEINLTDGGDLASIGVGYDEDGMARFVLAFSL